MKNNFSIFLIITGVLYSQENITLDKKEVFAKRISNNRIELDGFLKEDEWMSGLPASDFLQVDPDQGEPSSEISKIYILYDDDNLYIGAMLFDSNPNGIIAYQKRRDKSLRTDDRFMWILDTFLNGRSGYFFEVNPAGLMGDGLIVSSLSGGGTNKDWNGIWDARTKILSNGWSAEIAIPFRTLNFDPDLDEWGINFQRTVRRKNEDSRWHSYQRNKKLTSPIHAGLLKGLNNLNQSSGIEIKPYFSASNKSHGSSADLENNNINDFGFDISKNITPGLKASLTYNTDFAEAEVDQRRVNLTRFPLRYAEKRGFFLEGANVYSFSPRNDVTPFFSRRIGLSSGKQIPIRYGARLSGQMGKYQIGLIRANTEKLNDINAENFNIIRLKRSLLKQSYLGLVYTDRSSMNASIDSTSVEQSLYGFDLELKTSEFLKDKNLQFQTFLVYHTAPINNPNLTFSDLSTRGMRLTYPNDIIRSHVSYREFGKMYDPAVGFSRRNSFKRLQPSFSYHPRPVKYDFIRQMEFGISYEYMTDLKNNLLKRQTTITPLKIQFESQDEFGIKISTLEEFLDQNFTIYDDIVIPIGKYISDEVQLSFQTSEKRMLSSELEYRIGDFWNGKKESIETSISIKPVSGINIESKYENNKVNFGAQSFNTELYNFEFGIYPTPRTVIYNSLQYDNISKALGLFVKLQQTIKPGSDLFLVYTHNWISSGPQVFDFDLLTVSKINSIKINYTLRL